MKNEANNCYVNVVIQSLLPCSALMPAPYARSRSACGSFTHPSSTK